MIKGIYKTDNFDATANIEGAFHGNDYFCKKKNI
jgi:hypothetical protein